MNRETRIFVAGGATLLGAAIRDALRGAGFRNVVGEPPDEPDLTVAGQVDDFFGETQPEYVFFAGGKSGGIQLNWTRPADLMLDNLLAATHVLRAAHEHGVSKLLYMASSCTYPKHAPQPLRVESLGAGPLEPTSEAYATAKLSGLRLCQAYRRQYGARFIAAIPADAFGPHDDFGADSGHVIPALMRRAHEAKRRGEPELIVWGTGSPRREFLYSKDAADACLFVMDRYDGEAPINLGGGADLSVADAARAVADIVGYRGRIVFDAGRPDGAPLKRLDSGELFALGWRPSTDFRSALSETYHWFSQHLTQGDDHHVRAALPGAVPHPAP